MIYEMKRIHVRCVRICVAARLMTMQSKWGCNVVALGHHRDDIIETAFLSLSYEGRFYCFSPKTYLERSEVTVIRPFLYVDEYEIKNFARLEGYPVVKNPCPMDKTSKRAEVKALIKELEKKNRVLRNEYIRRSKKRNMGREELILNQDLK